MIKTKLSIKEQVEYMEKKGIKFNLISKEEAEKYLMESTYFFRLKAYCKNYSKDQNGCYKDLEFAYLKELSSIDQELRQLILKITIKLEHGLKVALQNAVCENGQEDGFNICREYFKECKARNAPFSPKKNQYNNDLIEKCEQNGYALWNIIEVITFGELNNLLICYMNRYGTILDNISKEDLENFMFAIKKLRNASAHNNCLINNLQKNTITNKKVKSFILKYCKTASQNVIDNNLRKLVVNDFVVMLYCINFIIKNTKERAMIYEDILSFRSKMKEHKEYFENNLLIKSTLNFVELMIDFFAKHSV